MPYTLNDASHEPTRDPREATWRLRDGTMVRCRPIRPEDEAAMVEFHRALSEESVRSRYFSLFGFEARVRHERLRRICRPEAGCEWVYAVERLEGPEQEIVAVGRVCRLDCGATGEVALLIRDTWQGLGLGTELLQFLVQVGREEGLQRLVAHILPTNTGMRRLSRKCGFELRFDSRGGEWMAEKKLAS